MHNILFIFIILLILIIFIKLYLLKSIILINENYTNNIMSSAINYPINNSKVIGGCNQKKNINPYFRYSNPLVTTWTPYVLDNEYQPGYSNYFYNNGYMYPIY